MNIDRTIVRYSDGDVVEEGLLALLKACDDVSCTSNEFLSHITDWPTEYHLSLVRHNLLRQFSFKPGDRILELGCGCGAITRYLGESGAEVIAVEGSERRAEIARERCRDLPNVSIICSHLMDFNADAAFDYVTLIGVLEYSPKYIDAADPVHACLLHAANFLSESGALIVAIENKLGLKYFNGHAEDHLGIPYFGIYNLYGSDTPITFGRAELGARIQAVGLSSQEFFFPFPDYKLPKVILAERALQVQNFAAANLLALMATRDPTGSAHSVFHEQMVWQSIIANGLLPDLANSFLVVAGKNESSLAKLDSSYLASAHTSSRLPLYTIDTIFRKVAHGHILVEKKSLLLGTGQKATHPFREGQLWHHVNTVSDYVPGTLYVIELQKRLARGEGIDSVIEWAKAWLTLLCAADHEKKHKLPGIWLDAIPQNFIRDSNGALHRIDDEWEISFPIPLAWIIVRGMINAFAVCPTSPALQGLSLRETIRIVAASTDIHLDETDFQAVIKMECELRAIIYGGDDINKNILALSTVLTQPPCATINSPTYFEAISEALSTENKLLFNEVNRVKTSISWRLTKPLRFLAFLWRKFGSVTRKHTTQQTL